MQDSEKKRQTLPRITLAAKRALTDMSAGPRTAASLGYAMTPDRDWPLKPQGAGRIGALMAVRLKRRGWVRNALCRNPQYYELTLEGREALERTS